MFKIGRYFNLWLFAALLAFAPAAWGQTQCAADTDAAFNACIIAYASGTGDHVVNVSIDSITAFINIEKTGTDGGKLTIKSEGAIIRTIKRGYNGDLFTLNGNTSLIFENIIIYGKKDNFPTNTGALVKVNDGATFEMRDGAVLRNNSASAVYINAVNDDAYFIMSGGEISGNSEASNGGGVYAGGTFTMNGGKIIGNTASNGGGGVFVSSSGFGLFIMNGGEISGNEATTGNGGGVSYNYSSVPFTVGGAAVIKNNRKGDGSANNVYFPTYCYFAINAPDPSMEIWVNKTANTGVIMSSGASAGQERYFFADDLTMMVVHDGVMLKLVDDPDCKANTEATFAACLAKYSATLAGDTLRVKVAADFSIAPQTITTTAAGATLIITSEGTRHTLTRGETGDLFKLLGSAHLILENIIIDGDKATFANAVGSLVFMDANTAPTLEMKDGAVLRNNKKSGDGGGVYCRNGCTFVMDGGEISGNEATQTGGGVFVSINSGSNYSTFTMNGGKITGNTAGGADGGGGVGVVRTGTFTMNGGEISDNSATQTGGGVSVIQDATFTIGGTAKITGNTKGGADNNVYLESGRHIEFDLFSGQISVNGAVGIVIMDNASETDVERFVSDDPSKIIKYYPDNGGQLKLVDNPICVAGNETDFTTCLAKYPNFGATETLTVKVAADIPNMSTAQTISATAAGATLVIESEGADDIKTLTRGTGMSDNFLTLGSNAKLVLRNIAISGVTGVVNSAVKVNHASATLEIENGTTITGNRGSLIHVYEGLFTMNGGAIKDNVDFSGAYGGGVNVEKGKFIMNDGVISGNSAGSGGGGVYVSYGTNSGGIFEMYGGTISGNSTGTGNGGGVFVNSNGTFKLGGTAVIKDNVKGSAANNVYLESGRYITLGTGENALADGAEIWVSTTNTDGVIVNSNATLGLEEYFKSDDDGKETVISENENIKILPKTNITYISKVDLFIEPPVTGSAPPNNADISLYNINDEEILSNGSVDDVMWTPPVAEFQPNIAYEVTATYTYWETDAAVVFTNATTATVNGEPATIALNNGKHEIFVSYTFPETNCNVSTLKQLQTCIDAYVSNDDDYTITVSQDFNITSPITINKASNPNNRTLTITSEGAAKTITRGATGNLFTLTGNAKLILENIIIDGDNVDNGSVSAALITVNAANAELVMNSGAVLKRNKSNPANCSGVGGGGGGVYVQNGKFTMNGGDISENRARCGGGVFVTATGIFDMKGGDIYDNTTTNNGGGVLSNGTFTMSGGNITGNKTENQGAGVVADGSYFFEMTGGTISGNEITGTSTASLGAGVYVAANATFRVGGSAKVIENTNSSGAQNVYLYNGSYITLSTATPPATGMSIGVTAPSGVIVNTGASAAAAEYFVSDVEGKIVKYENNQLKLANNPVCVASNAAELYDCNYRYADVPAGDTLTIKVTADISYTNLNIDASNFPVNPGAKLIITSGDGASKAITFSNAMGSNSIYMAYGDIEIDNIVMNAPVFMETGTFTMKSGKITGSTYGALFTEDGAFIMTGGEIIGNENQHNEGSVYIYKYGEALTVGGTAVIKDNTYNGEPRNVYLYNGVYITLSTEVPPAYGMEIWINGTGTPSGVIVQSGALPEHAAYFHSDDTTKAIKWYADNGGQLRLVNNPICEAGDEVEFAACVNRFFNNFATGDTLTILVTDDIGYGNNNISVENYGTLVVKSKSGVKALDGYAMMEDGELVLENIIIERESTNFWHGLVYMNKNSNTLELRNGAVLRNSGCISCYGAGVIVLGSFTMNGGEISGNTIYGDEGFGAGVYVFDNGTFTVGGTAKVFGNINNVSGKADNVYLESGKYITLATGDNAPRDGMEIWVTVASGHSGVIVQSGALPAHAAYFHSDDPTKEVVYDGGALKLVAKCPDVVTDYAWLKVCVDRYAEGNADKEINVTGNVLVTEPIEINKTVAGGTLTITGGGTITRDIADTLFVLSGSTKLVLENIVIDGNKDNITAASPLVKVNAAAEFTMNSGAVLRDNYYSSGVYGGGVLVNGGMFTMNGGAISGNRINYGGGGGGGGVYVNDGAFTMNGGKISGNSASNSGGGGGGGVYVGTATFIMKGGEISDNTANLFGGGVYNNNGTFTMNGGKIINNTATTNGGGVYTNSGTFSMTDGEISGNTITGNSNGGGVYVNGGTFTVGGVAVIKDNVKDGAANNVYLTSGRYITIASPALGMKIGVTTANTDGVIVDSGASAADVGYFVSDVEGKIVKYYSDNGGQLKLIDNPICEAGNAAEFGVCIEDRYRNIAAGDTLTILVADNISGGINGNAGVENGNGSSTLIIKSKSDVKTVTGFYIEIQRTHLVLENIIFDDVHFFSDFDNSTLEISNGVVLKNTGNSSKEGAVYFCGTVIMNGGEISGNKGFYDKDGGVNICNGTLTVGGAAKVFNNTNKDDEPSNVYLTSGSYITLATGDNAPRDGMEIWVTTETPSGVIVQSGALPAHAAYFHSDDPTKEVVYDGGALKLVAKCPDLVTDYAGLKVCIDRYAEGSADKEIIVSGNITVTEPITINKTVAGGTLTIKGGTLTRGVTGDLFTLSGNAKMALENIVIDGNEGNIADAVGSLVYVNSANASLEMKSEAELRNNKTTTDPGGTVYVNSGTFTMNGGKISGNTANSTSLSTSGSSGGVLNRGTFIMNDGEISGNTSTKSGGGVYSGGTFIMNGGKISDNSAAQLGGGMYISSGSGSVFTMNDGEISGNEATLYGGGVYMPGTNPGSGLGNIIMNGGKIIGNKSGNGGGGGVCISNGPNAGGNFTMTGGEISGNETTGNGGGMSFSGTTFTIGGTAKIINNVNQDGVSNLYLTNGKYIALDNPAQGMSIGIATSDADGVIVQSGASEDDAGYFIPDEDGYGVWHDNGALKVLPITYIANADFEMTAPVTDEAPATPSIDPSSDAGFTIKDVEWVNLAQAPAVYEQNTEYTIKVTFEADVGYLFADGTKTKTITRDFPATDRKITNLALEIEPPLTDESPTYAASNVTGEGFDVKSVSWSPAIASEFLHNETYTVTFELEAQSGYTFPKDLLEIAVSINDDAPSKIDTLDNRKTLTVAYEFAPTANKIPEADVEITAPATDNAPEYENDIIPIGSYFAITSVKWNNETPSVFLPNTEYTATVTLTADDDYVFANGKKTLTITREFPRTAHWEILEASVEVTAAAPETGETPDYAGSIVAGTGFVIESVLWSPALSDSGKFMPSTEYTAEFTLAANTDSYLFEGGKEKITVSFTFPETEALTIIEHPPPPPPPPPPVENEVIVALEGHEKDDSRSTEHTTYLEANEESCEDGGTADQQVKITVLDPSIELKLANNDSPKKEVLSDGSVNHNIDFEYGKPLLYTLNKDGEIVSEDTLIVVGKLDYSKIIMQKWNILIINNNSKTNGGYTFSEFNWYKNGEKQVGYNRQYYSEPGNAILNASDSYFVELATSEGIKISTCPGNPDPTATAPVESSAFQKRVLGVSSKQGKTGGNIYDGKGKRSMGDAPGVYIVEEK